MSDKAARALYTRLRAKTTGEVWIVIFKRGDNIILINEAQTVRRHVSKAAINRHYEAANDGR